MTGVADEFVRLYGEVLEASAAAGISRGHDGI